MNYTYKIGLIYFPCNNSDVAHIKGWIIAVGTKQDISDENLYRRVVGSVFSIFVGALLDISFYVCRLNIHVKSPNKERWVIMKRYIRYISGTSSAEIIYQTSESLTPIAHRDSDWRWFTLDHKFTRGYVFLLTSGYVSCKSRVQGFVTHSCS